MMFSVGNIFISFDFGTYTKLCENIGIFIKNNKSLTLGQLKLCMDHVQTNPKKKKKKFLYFNTQNRTFVKKTASEMGMDFVIHMWKQTFDYKA